VSITTAGDDILAGETITIELDTSGSGLQYPSHPSSISSPYEWGVTITNGAAKYAGSLLSTLAPG